jgi:hypothetical protein
MRRFAPSIFLAFFILFFGISQMVFAQSAVEEGDITSTVIPEIPGPLQRTTITLQSYITDLNRAFISWQINGKQDLSGYGKKQLSFTTGNTGETTTITYSIRPVSGELIQNRIVVNPAEINLLWEGADSYTPPFYRGRALPGPEGLVRVVALPQIKSGNSLLKADDYIFTWKRQDSIVQGSSGFGKNSFVFQKDYLNPNETIGVTGQNNATGSKANAEIVISGYIPKILFYEKNSLLGVRSQETLKDGFSVAGNDKTIIAIPYFVSPQNATASELTYEWKINGESTPTPSPKNILTLRSGTQKGTAVLNLHISSLKKLFLDVAGRLSINLQ